jgi:tetratricopeptide (TPR) repeat protein
MRLLSRIWAPRGNLTMVEAFRRADRYRREGRFPQAVEMVTYGLRLDPSSLTGHLLAAYLHAASRTMAPAKAEFQWVLSRDPNHARALLGLARIAFEEGDVEACRSFLARALRFYPEFPEAKALLDAVASRPVAPPAPVVPVASATPAAVDRLRLPAHARALVLARPDGALLAVRPADVDGAPLAATIAHILGVAAATMTRAGFAAIRRAIVEDEAEALFIRTDGTLVLSLALPRTTQITQGLLEVNRLWAGARLEAEASAPPVVPVTDATTASADASDRRVS